MTVQYSDFFWSPVGCSWSVSKENLALPPEIYWLIHEEKGYNQLKTNFIGFQESYKLHWMSFMGVAKKFVPVLMRSY